MCRKDDGPVAAVVVGWILAAGLVLSGWLLVFCHALAGGWLE